MGRLVLLARSQQGQPEAAIHRATGRTESAGFGSAAAEDRSGEVRSGLLACGQVVDAAQSLHHLGIAGRFADGQFLLDVHLQAEGQNGQFITGFKVDGALEPGEGP